MKEQIVEIVTCEKCKGTGLHNNKICIECNGKKERKIVKFIEQPHIHIKK